MVRLKLHVIVYAQVTDYALILSQLNTIAHKRLIKRAFSLHEFPSLIETVLSDKEMDGMIHRLSVTDAQTFVDVINEARITPTRP